MRQLLVNLLEKLSQSLQSQSQRQIIKGIASIFTLRVIQKALGLATTYFLVRTLSQEQFGEYNLVLNFAGILTVFALKGLDGSIMQSSARGFPGTYRKAVPIAFLSSFIGALIMAGISAWYWKINQSELAAGFIIAAFLFPFFKSLDQWKSIKVGEENFTSLLRIESMVLIFMHAAIIVSAILKPNVYLLPICFFMGMPAIQNLLITCNEMSRIRKNQPTEPGSIGYGIKTSIYSAFSLSAQHIDKLLLFYFLSPETLAVFVAATQIPDLAYNVIQDIAIVLAPRFAKQDTYTKDIDKIIRAFSFLISASILIVTFTILPWIFLLIYGETYTEAVPYAQALLSAVALGNLATFHFRYIRSRFDTNNFRNITFLTTGARIATAIVLIPLFGLTGAIISVFAYRLALLFTVQYAMHKFYKPV